MAGERITDDNDKRTRTTFRLILHVAEFVTPPDVLTRVWNTVYLWCSMMQIRLLSQSPSVAKYDLSCLRVIITGGGILSSTIRYFLISIL